MRRKLVNFLSRIFTRKKYELKHAHKYKVFLKHKTKNQLVRLVIALETKIAITNNKSKSKASKKMHKSQNKEMQTFSKVRTK